MCYLLFCRMVSARAFIGQQFFAGDGAFAQGVLIAFDNLAMIASKNIVPQLIEYDHHHHEDSRTSTPRTSTTTGDTNSSIRLGLVACCVAQLISVVAGFWYAYRCGSSVCGRQQEQRQQQQQQQQRDDDDNNDHHHNAHRAESAVRFTTEENMTTTTKIPATGSSLSGGIPPSTTTTSEFAKSALESSQVACQLPITFWIVAWGRAIFLVTFKVFSRYSNSFLIVSCL